MGKAAKLKKIRRLASQLPAMKDVAMIGSRITGSELIAAGVKEVEGKEVKPHLDYRKKQKVHVPLNHYKKMKGYFNQYGGAGVKGYAEAVLRHAKQHNIPTNAIS